MRIRMRDGRLFEGTALQIVKDMKSIAFGQSHLTVSEYIEWAADGAARTMDIKMDLKGETDDEKARALIRVMLRTKLAVEG